MAEDDFSLALKTLLTPGNAVRFHYAPGNPNNEIRHIRAIVDDEYIAYRVWSRKKRRWTYHISWYYDFLLAYQANRLTIVSRSEHNDQKAPKTRGFASNPPQNQ